MTDGVTDPTEMIKYTLTCDKDHRFDSWFRDSQAFDDLAHRKMLSCSVCGSPRVEKAIMAPNVSTSETAPEPGPLSGPLSPAEAALRELREHVTRNAEDVGDRFAREARAIHNGEAPDRAIYGEARLKDAKELLDDGVPVAPLPWPNKNTN